MNSSKEMFVNPPNPELLINIFSTKTVLSYEELLSLIPSDREFSEAGYDLETLMNYEKQDFLSFKCAQYFRDKILRYYNKKLFVRLSEEIRHRLAKKIFEECVETLFPNYHSIRRDKKQEIQCNTFKQIKLLIDEREDLIIKIRRTSKNLKQIIEKSLGLWFKDFYPSDIDLSSEPHIPAVEDLFLRSLFAMVKNYEQVNLLKMSLEELHEILTLISTSSQAEDFFIQAIIFDLEQRLLEKKFKFIQEDLLDLPIEKLEILFGFKKNKKLKESNSETFLSKKTRFPKRKTLHSLEPGTFIEKPLFEKARLESAALGYVVREALEALLNINIDAWKLDKFGYYYYISSKFNSGNYLKFSFNRFDSKKTAFEDESIKKIFTNKTQSFWIDVAKLHLLFSAYAATNLKPHLHPLFINFSDIIESLGWNRRHDLSQSDKIDYLWEVIETLGQLKVLFSWTCSEHRYTCSPHPIWQTSIYYETEKDEFGDWKEPEYVVLKLEPGIWTEVFLNQNPTDFFGKKLEKKEALCQWGYLSLDTLQINSYQNNLAARLALYLTSNVDIHHKNRAYKVETLLKKIGEGELVKQAKKQREKKRQLKEKFFQALNVLKELGWQIHSENLDSQWLSQEVFIEQSEFSVFNEPFKFRRFKPKRVPQPFDYRWTVKSLPNGEIEYQKLDPQPPEPADIKEGTKTFLYFNTSYFPLIHQRQEENLDWIVEINSDKKANSTPVLRPVTGDQLKEARIARFKIDKGMTKNYLASCLGVSPETLRRIEQGERELENDELERIQKLFTEEELFNDDQLFLSVRHNFILLNFLS